VAVAEEWSTPDGRRVTQDSEQVTFRGETLFVMRASLGQATVKARSRPVTDRLNEIAGAMTAEARSSPPARRRVLTIDRREDGVWNVRIDGEPLVTVHPDDADVEALVTGETVAVEELARAWQRRLQGALDELTRQPSPRE
jgi:hypothetical protein